MRDARKEFVVMNSILDPKDQANKAALQPPIATRHTPDHQQALIRYQTAAFPNATL